MKTKGVIRKAPRKQKTAVENKKTRPDGKRRETETRRHRSDQIRNKIRNIDPDVKHLKVSADHLMRIGTKQYIYKFDPRVLNTKIDGKRIGIIGASGSGKTRLVKELMRIHREIPVWTIFNPSESGNHAYTPHVENGSIIHDNDDIKSLLQELAKFKKRQIKKCKDWTIPNTDPPQFDPDPSAALILDDMTQDAKIFNDPMFGWLFNISRNFKTWMVLMVQYVYIIPKKYRRQFSHLFLFAMSSGKDIKDIYMECAPMFKTYDDFKYAFTLATEKKGGSLVIDVLSQSSKIEEKVFWYHHEVSQPPFKVGAEWFNKIVRHLYDPKWEERSSLEANARMDLLKKSEKAPVTKRGRSKHDPLDIELV